MKQTVSGSVRPTDSAWPRAYSRATARSAADSSGAVRVRRREPGRVGERRPSVGRFDSPPDGPPAVAPDPQRRPGPLPRSGEHGVARGPETRAVDGHALPGPGRLHGGQRLVHPVVAVGEGGAQRVELRFQVAGTEADDHAAAAQHVEGGDSLGGQERVAVGEDEEVGVEQDRRGGRGRERQGDQRVERVVAPVGQPLVAGERVLGGVDGAEAGGLGGGRQLGDGSGGEELVAAVDPVGGQAVGDAHALRSPARPSRPGTPASARGDPWRRPPRAR